MPRPTPNPSTPSSLAQDGGFPPLTSKMSAMERVHLLELMYLSREGDRREGVLLRQGKGWFQVAGMGHESLAAIARLMTEDDYLFPYYRDRAMVLARGITNYELALAYFAKRSSSSGGRQMPGHYSSFARKIWSVPTPTGSNLLPACGAAWSLQLRSLTGVVVATIGDAATRQGEFYEAISFATERNLPVVFVVEDNRYGISTNTDSFNPFKLGIFGDSLAIRYVNARHVGQVHLAATVALRRARDRQGPSILVCELDRLCSHTSSDDHRVYRPPQEISEMLDRDPIHLLADELIAAGSMTRGSWESRQAEIDEQVDCEYRHAELADDPAEEQLLDQLVAVPPTVTAPPLDTISTKGRLRMVDAINQVFHTGLQNDDHVFFGQDIADPKGGVFGLTAGLSTASPNRAFNAPLAEATIAGVACGMASVGMRPIFEIQFVDFIGPAWNQITQNLATLRWRSNGDWQCPMVIYAPYGAYLPGGSLWHSQANESWFAHVPGLRVVVPSTPEDAAGLMWTAMHTNDPTIVLLPKHLLRKPIALPPDFEGSSAVPFGKARIHRDGTDVTLVSWGNCMELALEVADNLASTEDGKLSIEVIDLRTLQPWDRVTIAQSLAKTGRLVIVQEDGVSCSVGQMIISDLSSDTDVWYTLLSPPQLVAKPDVHIGYNPIYEYAALPSKTDITAAVRKVMEE